MNEETKIDSPESSKLKLPKTIVNAVLVKIPLLKRRKWQVILGLVLVIFLCCIGLLVHNSVNNSTPTIRMSCNTVGVKIGLGTNKSTLVCTNTNGKLTWQEEGGLVTKSTTLLGEACSPAGSKIGGGPNITYICTLVKGKLIWQREVGGADLGNANSLNPVTKGKYLSNGQCSGSGSAQLTHAPMNIQDISDIQPMGLMSGPHVTPVDHEYYFGADQNAPVNTYPVYADTDGTIVAVGFTNDGTKDAWWVTIAYSCTFGSNYNLITSITPAIKAALPQGWGPNSMGNVHIPIKSGELIGYVGHQPLDFQVWNTQTTLKGFLHPIAYNNAEPWKVNIVRPLDYFTASVKSQILPLYIRTVAPLDGKIDNDVINEAVGNWFKVGSNGYAGTPGGNNAGIYSYSSSHLALAYDYINPGSEVFSIGDYQGQPMQFSAIGNPDWTKIKNGSGIAKVQLGRITHLTANGVLWEDQFAKGISFISSDPQATALIEVTGPEEMKVEVFPGKTPAQVSSFDSSAVSYDRGQNAHMIQSTSATN